MKYFKPAVLLLVFAAGAGIVGTRTAVRNFIRQAIINPDILRRTSERDLVRKLKLDTDQQARVHQILGQTQEDIRGLRNEFLPRLDAAVSKTTRAFPRC